MKILLIEPDQRTAHDMAVYLHRQHHVRVAGDGQAAIQLIDAERPEVIVLEPAMPAHNGVEFLYELRSYDDLLDIPVVLFSSLSPDQLGLDARQQRQLGIAHICYKPRTSLKQLANVLTDVVQTPA